MDHPFRPRCAAFIRLTHSPPLPCPALPSQRDRSEGTPPFAVGVTFISAELDVSEQANLYDLPEQSQNQVRLPFPQILRSNIDNVTPDGGGRIQRQVQVFL